jgi:protein ImuB
MGVYTAGQALRLPRAGFARRFGSAQLASLDRLTGRLADPRIRFMPRERFRRIRDLPWELETHEALLRALGPMLKDMENFLRARQAGITVLECRFRHRNVAATPCILHLAAPAADAQRLGMLLGERLSSIVLPAPVRSCELRTDVIVPLAQACHSLWQPGEHGGEGTTEGAQLIEYLRARLSAQAVHGVQLVPDHRPEKASCVVEPRMRSGPSSLHSAQRPRPLWLLAAPQSLSARAGQPWYHGPLQIELPMDKERIEATSWEEDFKNLARDYYVAVDVRQVRLWIFRERTAPHRWFLHGVFG